MLKFQITIIAILICCMSFMSCDRTHDALEHVMMEAEPEMMDTDDMMEMMETLIHREWMSVSLDAPMMTVEEAAAAMNAAGTGQAHGTGVRTVYFNEDAAMANMAEGAKMYPVGSTIVKEVMDDENTMVVHVATMTKTDDPMYMDRGGWIYGVGGNNLDIAGSEGCDTCHAKAGEGNDYVFVSLKTADDGMTDGTTGEGEGTTGEGEGTTGEGDGTNGEGDGTNGEGDGA